MKTEEVCKTMCATCPFREGSPYADLAVYLTQSALSENSRICHSTGSNAINQRTGKREKLCRGARDAQIKAKMNYALDNRAMNQRTADNLINLYGLSERWSVQEFAHALGCQQGQAGKFMIDAEARGLVEKAGVLWKRVGPRSRQSQRPNGGLLFQ